MPHHTNVNFEEGIVSVKHNFKFSFRQHLFAYLSISSLDLELLEKGNICLVHSCTFSTSLYDSMCSVNVREINECKHIHTYIPTKIKKCISLDYLDY